jgi:hypothetical protein
MTIIYPDISSVQKGLVLRNIPAVTIKATQSTNYVNPYFATWKAQAQKIGAVADAYHFLVKDNGAAQADFAFDTSGGMPMMVDIEQNPADKVFPTVQDVNDFIRRYHGRGRRITKLYWPQWVWSSMGSPELAGYNTPIVNADYSGSGGWNSYGGVNPTILQFSETYTYNGYSVDFNVFNGTLEQYKAIIYGDSISIVSASPKPKEVEIMTQCNNQGEAGLIGDEMPVGGVAWVGIDMSVATPLKLRPVILLPTGPEVLDDVIFDATSNKNLSAAIHWEKWAASALALTVTRVAGSATYYIGRPRVS